MVRKHKEARKLTDAERHKQFVAMAREVGADEAPGSFDRAFDKVVKPSEKPKKPRQ